MFSYLIYAPVTQRIECQPSIHRIEESRISNERGKLEVEGSKQPSFKKKVDQEGASLRYRFVSLPKQALFKKELITL